MLTIVYQSVSLSVMWMLHKGFTVQTWLNRSRSCLGWDSRGPKEHCIIKQESRLPTDSMWPLPYTLSSTSWESKTKVKTKSWSGLSSSLGKPLCSKIELKCCKTERCWNKKLGSCLPPETDAILQPTQRWIRPPSSSSDTASLPRTTW